MVEKGMSMEDENILETEAVCQVPDAAFIDALVTWYRENARELPWREDRDPYHIWVSEIMLQQTTISAVIGYYRRFLNELPTVADLAKCPDDKLMKLWEGLGYYSRVRHLKAAAVTLTELGYDNLPADYDSIRSLPGIGAYTAGAVSSMAFRLPYPAVDGNVLRIMTRLSATRCDVMKASTKTFYEKYLTQVMRSRPDIDPGLLNEGLMELGEVICVPHGETLCEVCPVNTYCEARRLGLTQELPVRIIKTKRHVEEKTVLLMHFEDKVAIRKREAKGLLAGLYEFPNVDGHSNEDEIRRYLKERAITPVRIKPIVKARHLFSHIEWQMIGYDIEVAEVGDISDIQFVTRAEIGETYAIPGAFKAYKRYLDKHKAL